MSDTPDLVLVRVEWHDAHVGTDGWVSKDELEDDGPYVVHSCGFLLTEEHGGKAGHITLVMSWSNDDMLHSVSHIPSQMVRKIEILARSHELGNAALFSA